MEMIVPDRISHMGFSYVLEDEDIEFSGFPLECYLTCLKKSER